MGHRPNDAAIGFPCSLTGPVRIMHTASGYPPTSPILGDVLHLRFTQGKTMETKYILILMFVIFCAFMVANWLNRPKPTFKKTPDKPME